MHNIVIEGQDATGKSTLATFLSLKLRMPIKESEGPTASVEHFLERASRYEQLQNHIIVRHPHVSESIYGTARETYLAYTKNPDFLSSLNRYYQSQPLVIYCMPPTASFHHKVKAHDTDDHIRLLQEHKHTICGLYRAWAQLDADLYHQIGHSMHRLLSVIERLRFDPLIDITNFHAKFGFPPNPRHHTVPTMLTKFRANFMHEEAREYLEACNANNNADILDALVDQVYITLGTAYLHGFSRYGIFEEAWRRVHRANMQKQRSLNPYHDSERGSGWDIVKPLDWTPPSLDDLVSNSQSQESGE